MSRNENQAAIAESRRLDLPEVNMSLSVPQLPGYSETIVKLVQNDRSRGVVDHYVLFGEDDFGAPTAAIAITELPPQLRNRSDVFLAVTHMQRRAAAPAGLEPSFQLVPGPFGQALETINPGRIGSQCFPTADWHLAEGGAKDSTLGINRFVLIGNKLVEFALILKVGPQRSFDEQAAYARQIMDRYWLALTPEALVANEPTQPPTR